MHVLLKRFILPGLVLCLAAASPARADCPLDSVRTSLETIQAILDDKGLTREEQVGRVKVEVYRVFDFAELSKRAMGKPWNGLNPEQRLTFVTLFAELLEKTYIDKISLARGSRIDYGRELVKGNKAMVMTVVHTEGKAIPVNYKLINKDGAWRVYDVAAEGVSLVKNYREQFQEFLHDHGAEQLFDRLREMIKEQDAKQAAAGEDA